MPWSRRKSSSGPRWCSRRISSRSDTTSGRSWPRAANRPSLVLCPVPCRLEGSMNRRDTIFSLLALGGAPFTSLAQQQSAKALRIGWLAPGTRGKLEVREWEAFLQALKDAGYVEGRDVVIDERVADGRQEKLPALAAELVALNPAVIVTYSTAGVTAVKNASTSVPIVFAS